MYSDALRILDANTTQYMIEIQQEEIHRLKEEQKKNALLLEENQKQLAEQREENNHLKALLAQLKKE